MIDVTFGAAFLAGMVSFLTPCVLPIVPPYLAYLAGISFAELTTEQRDSEMRAKILFSSIFFVLGFSAVFIAFGATVSAIGQVVAQYFDTLSIIAGAIIILMGLHFLGIFRIGMLYREARIEFKRRPVGYAGAFVMGLAFAFGWTPCVGPILASILLVAAGENTMARGAFLLAAYSLGIGIPFIVAAAFAGRFVGWSSSFKRHMRAVEMAMGGMLVLTGILFITGSMSYIAQWLLDTFPGFQSIG